MFAQCCILARGGKVRLLIIEDNERMGLISAKGLEAFGYCVDIALNLNSASELLAAASYDLLILDLGLPDGDGSIWLNDQRAAGLVTPIIILTARSALGDRVKGLDAGADDYVIKPFALEELAARARALLRRPGALLQAVIQVGPISFDTARRSGTCNDIPLHLSQREAALMELLLIRAGTVVTRDQIEASLYSFNDPVTPNAIEVLISRLRRKLGNAGGHDLLVTLRGVGYLLLEE